MSFHLEFGGSCGFLLAKYVGDADVDVGDSGLKGSGHREATRLAEGHFVFLSLTFDNR